MYKSFFSLFFFLTFSKLVGAQEIVNTKHYAIEEGLNSRIVGSICRSETGLFYILCQNEVQVFDGRTIKQEGISCPSTFKIHDAKIASLTSGEIIVLVDSQRIVYHLDEQNNSLIPLELPKLKRAKVIDGVFYFLSKNGSVFKHDEGGASLLYKGGKQVKDFYYTNDYIYLLDTKGHLSRVSKNGKEVHLYEGVKDIAGMIRSELWTVSEGGVAIFNSHSDKIVHRIGEYNKVIIRHDKVGNTLLGLSSNYQRIREMFLYPANGDEKIAQHKLLDFTDTVIDFFSEDFTKHILLCTYNGLIHHRVSDLIKPFHKYPQKREGTFGNLVSNIFYRSRDSSIYLMREVTGLMKLVGDDVIDVQEGAQNVLLDGRKYDLYDEKRDVLFTSSTTGDLNNFHEYDFSNEQLTSINIDVSVNTMKPYNDDLLILGGEDYRYGRQVNGAVIVYDKRSSKIVFRQTFLVPHIFDVLFHEGDLYLGTRTGLYVIKEFDINEDSSKMFLTTIDVNSGNYFYLDTLHDGRIIAGKAEHGLVFIDDDKIGQTISVEEGLCDNNIASIKYDFLNQAYWIGTFNGIAVLDTSFNILNTFLYKDGMPSSETNRFAVTEDEKGNYYYGTINGLARFNPSKLIKDGHLEKYLPDFIRYKKSNAEYRISLIEESKRSIPYVVDHVDIQYQTRDYLTEERYQRWKYFEIESDKEKDKFDVSHGIIEAYLPESGTRNIKVFKRGEPDLVYMQMTIHKKSFVSEYYSIALISILFAGLIWMLVNITKKRAVASDALKVSEAERELAEAHLHSLRSQMNPHFIFNALGSIQYYIETNKSEIATDYLSDFAMLMRLILESSKNELISFKNEIKQLNLYMTLEHMRFEAQYDYEVNIDREIDKDFQIPPMIVQPFIENAINHGLYHLTKRRGKLSVDVKYLSEDAIKFIIADNGIGRKASKELRRSQHISRGMEIVNERIKALKHKSFFVDLEVKDLKIDGKDSGTEVNITFTYD